MHRPRESTLVETHLILETEETRPAAEDEGVVRGENGDDVNTLRLELVVLLQIGREMVDVAGGLEHRRRGRARMSRWDLGWRAACDIP